MTDNGTPRLASRASTISAIYIATAVLLTLAYLIVFIYRPLSAESNESFLNLVTPLSATVLAAIATANYSSYRPQDLPRKVWFNLMTGCWLWVSAEVLWIALDADLSAADAAWFGGYVFFTQAFYNQYAIIFPKNKKLILLSAVGAWAVALLTPLLGFLGEEFTFANYLNYYYPIADFFIAAAGLALIFVFRGGALLRPWIGLVVFGFSDLFYAWANQAGFYETNEALTLAISVSYLVAYLIYGHGFLEHWLLLTYGLKRKS